MCQVYTMKIYVAAKFEKKDLVLDTFKKLKDLGHSISYDWTYHKNYRPYDQNQEMAAHYSQNELSGIENCDVFIYFSEDRGHTLHMEFGSALAFAKKTGKPIIYAIGEFNSKSPWFFNPLVKRRNSIEEVLEEIKKM